MKQKQTYVVLASRGAGWEIHGPVATEYQALKDAEAAAHALSTRYPAWTVGVYELRTLFGTQQKVVKQKIEPAEAAVRRKVPATLQPEADNVVKLRTTS